MAWRTLRDLVLRLRGLAQRGRMERRLDGEMGFHLDMLTAKYVRAGLSPADARW